jgi:hypothetical protein
MRIQALNIYPQVRDMGWCPRGDLNPHALNGH